MPTNRQIILDNRPEAEATASNFKLVSGETPALADGQVLVRHHFLSLDPYMRGRMNESKSYAVPQPLGEVMIGGTVGEVVESRHPKFKAGDPVVGMGGWQEYSVVDGNVPGLLRKADTTHVPLSYYLGAVGMPGVTAWYGLTQIIAPRRARRWWSAPPPAPWAAPTPRWPRRVAAAWSASPAERKSAATPSRNCISTPASTTASTATSKPCRRR